MNVNLSGLIVGIVLFLLIGVFHVIVIKAEYYWGKECWPAFLLAGLFSILLSLFLAQTVISILCAVFGITCLWSIKELFEQEKRVQKGWFPQNPRRKKGR